jgi:hypothetical protein
LVAIVLLALVLSPLAAWPMQFGNGETQNQTLQVPSYPDQSSLVSELQAQILSLTESVKAKDKLLSEQKTMLENSLSNSASRGETLATAESLLGEIGSLKELSAIKDVAYDKLKADYDKLAADYQAKVDESAGYFKQTAVAVATSNAKDKDSRWSVTLGGAAVYDKGAYGVDAMLGVGYGGVTVFGGATYMLDNGLDFLNLDSYTYKAGLLFTF